MGIKIAPLMVTGGFLITEFLFPYKQERNSTVASVEYGSVITSTLCSEILNRTSQQLHSRCTAWQQIQPDPNDVIYPTCPI